MSDKQPNELARKDAKVYVRQCERFTIWQASEPIEVDVEKLRKCVPPYKGETEKDLLEYLQENVDNEWAENTTNKEVYGEDAIYGLTFAEYYSHRDMDVYADTREKYGQRWLDIGEPNDEWTKMGGFEVRETSVDDA
jgi:hypothetical protein